MLDGFQGRTITVMPVDFSARDAYDNAIETPLDPVQVDDVLIAPSEVSDDIEDGRPYGIETRLRLYIPKGFDIPLRGASVEVDGIAYKVVGSPVPYPEELVPTGRNLVVEVVRFDG